MKIQIATLSSAVFLMAAAQCNAADFPRQGEAEYDTYYVGATALNLETAGVAMGGVEEILGVTRNVEGQGPFHDMSVRCLYQWSQIGEAVDAGGSCIETDRDGDEIFTTFANGTHTIVGGTGKYKGITGKATYTIDFLHNTNGGHTASLIKHKAVWQIK